MSRRVTHTFFAYAPTFTGGVSIAGHYNNCSRSERDSLLEYQVVQTTSDTVVLRVVIVEMSLRRSARS